MRNDTRKKASSSHAGANAAGRRPLSASFDAIAEGDDEVVLHLYRLLFGQKLCRAGRHDWVLLSLDPKADLPLLPTRLAPP